jgi:hypothetical protein
MFPHSPCCVDKCFLIPLIASELELMNAKWALLMGICQEILGVTIKDWIGPFPAEDISGLLFPSGILTSGMVQANVGHKVMPLTFS